MSKIFQLMLKLAGILCLLAACVYNEPPPTAFYVLESTNSPAGPVNGSVNKTVIGIGPITIPVLLDRKQIVTRTDENTVQIAEFHQWAGPLRDNILRVLMQNLAALQSRQVIRAYPWSAYGSVDYRVIIDIDRFDTQPGHTVNLEAHWAIMHEKTHAIIFNDRIIIEHPLVDLSYPATVKALNRVLNELSQQLSLALGQAVRS